MMKTLHEHNRIRKEIRKGHPAGVLCDKCGTEMRMRTPGMNVSSVPVYCPDDRCGFQGYMDLSGGAL